MKSQKKYIFLILFFTIASGFFNLSVPQTPPQKATTDNDSLNTIFPVAKTVPETYKDVEDIYPIDLSTPKNFNSDFEYNPVTNRYELRTKIGGEDITTPITLTPDEYYKYSLQRSMDLYYRDKYTAELDSVKMKKSNDALSPFDFKVNIGPADKIFGPGGVRLNANGSLTTQMGFTHTSTGNPTLTERQRNHTTFDFNTKIQTNVKASVGDKLNFNMDYNTESTFDFDTKQLKLGYVGKEDEIVKNLEAGNVSMNTSNSLIRGGAALFGIKTQLQFGKLTVDAVFSQQESQSNTVSTTGNTQTTPFQVTVDNYEENMHYLLAHYFYDKYDTAMSTLPYILSPINIDRIELWVTNRTSNFNNARNIVAFADLGEHDLIGNPTFTQPVANALDLPFNGANNLYSNIVNNYPGARDISTVTQSLTGLVNGQDYEKVENARLLDASEYTYNAQLGYISLNYPLQPDDVFAVAFSYKYQGTEYQVGEFSTDNPGNTTANLYVKLLKGASTSPALPTWKLMMKNVYPITTNNQSLAQAQFQLNIQYLQDTTGVYLNYITEGKIANQILLRVMRLDRLNSRNEPGPDGFYDFVPGLTVIPAQGKIIFPVIEPFGSYLRTMIGNDTIANKYVYQELYDSTLTVARQMAEKNKFVLAGQYQGSSASNINLNGSNIAPGSITVTANGVVLKENVDYTVDYSTGQVTIINPLYQNANIQTSSEDRSTFGMQRKTMMGLNLNYAVNKQFNIGATVMNLSEMPLTLKTEPGQESVDNTLVGFNVNYATQSQLLTNLLDKIPLLQLTAPSQITLTAEYARLFPGHYKSKYGGDYSYIDDFENAKQIIDMLSPYAWNLSSTPSMFPESQTVNDISSGKNRSLLAWYSIDPLFTRSTSITPTHIKNDLDQLSSNYVREILESELFPDKDPTFGESATVPVLNFAYYPKERGPYNLDVAGMNQDGTLSNPQDRWGGITRSIESGNTDFEANNIETLEFWLLDPFTENENATGGDLYFNLGDVSEDILKDEQKFFENGLPVNGDTTLVKQTTWGYMPTQQSLVYAFDNATNARKMQDVGLDGLATHSDTPGMLDEFTHPTYATYLSNLNQVLPPETIQAMQNDPFSPLNDPAGDNYHFYRGSDFDAQQMSILGRYKHFNGTEGNSADASTSPENYNTASKLTPDVEDINQDNTLNETENYFQYKVSLRPDSMVVGKNFIVQKLDVTPLLKNGKTETVSWYQFKIPLSQFQSKGGVGTISDFRTIRFLRMFLTNFSDSVILRFGTLQFSYGQWRIYTQDLVNPQLPPQGIGSISMGTVNVEESGSKQPVNYLMPPGVNRILDPGQTQLRQQNEQSMSLVINNLSQGDTRSIYKSTGLDTRQYRRLQMFAHAEQLADLPSNLQDNDLSVFIRLGSDYQNNYYEYSIPLKITPPGRYNDSDASRLIVWPQSNMFDFPFTVLTNAKLERNKQRQIAGSGVSYTTPFSTLDPNNQMNTVTIVGNPTISNIKVVMIGVRNNSQALQSAEVWVDELRLTDFNEDGGWAGNANLFVGLSDMGSVSFSGNKQTSGFGSLDQGIMDRNIDGTYQYNVATQLNLGRFFPEKAKVSIPFTYSYTENATDPKYNPVDQDILMKDALDALQTKADKDSLNSIAQNKKITKAISFNSVKVDIRSKRPMPYDPANFTFDYSHVEDYLQDATTQHEQTIADAANLTYSYAPMFKPWKPFNKSGSGTGTGTKSGPGIGAGAAQNNNQQSRIPQKNASSGSGSNSGSGFLKNFEIGFLPKAFEIDLGRTRNYDEIQLRDLSDLTDNSLPPSFRDDFYWNRALKLQWNLTRNLNFSFNSGTNARVETLQQTTDDYFMPDDAYLKSKKSVWENIKDLGDPMDYKQNLTANYSLPFNMVPGLNFITGALSYTGTYEWQKGAAIGTTDGSTPTDNTTPDNMGNVINNSRTMGINNLQFDLLSLYNKSKFLSDANKRFTSTKAITTIRTPRSPVGPNAAAAKATAAKQVEAKKKNYKGAVTLNRDSATVVVHNLNNKRIIIAARDEKGKRYALKYKIINPNSIKIQNKDSVKLTLLISQLPPLENEGWYKTMQVVARGLMSIRSFGFNYQEGNDMMLPNFSPGIGDFFGQGSTMYGNAPGWDFAFGLTDENYIQRAVNNNWFVNSDYNITPAMVNKTSTFNFTANLEPIAGMRIVMNATRSRTDQKQIYFQYGGNDLNAMSQQLTGNFRMTTISLGSAFESGNANNGYYSHAFQNFLNDRAIIANRLQQVYNNTTYPNTGFLQSTSFAGQPYDLQNGNVDVNSTDVLIPAFIAAYTGQDPKSVGMTAFPALKRLLPNWKVTYDGLMKIPVIKKNFKTFTLEHAYTSVYSVGAYNSYSTWAGTDEDGIGFTQNVTNGNPIPSSAYNILAVSIAEGFNPLLGVNSTLANNMNLSLRYNTLRSINLNVSAYQIVETLQRNLTLGTGYLFNNFNRVLKIRKTGGANFNNEMRLSLDVSYNMTESLIRRIEDALTQATSGNADTMIKLAADYSLSKMITLQAFYDRQMSNPLISATAYPITKSSFGLSLKVSLMQQ